MILENVKLDTLDDAWTIVINSGISEWFDGDRLENLSNYLYKNSLSRRSSEIYR